MTSDWVTTCALTSRTLRDRRASGVRVAAIGLAFSGLGLWMLLATHTLAFPTLIIVFGLLGMLVGVARSGSPATLVLDEHGFEYHQPIGRSMRQSWSECEDFGVIAVGRTQMVAWRSGSLRNEHPRSSRIARTLTGEPKDPFHHGPAV
jgi:hypothetical protein